MGYQAPPSYQVRCRAAEGRQGRGGGGGRVRGAGSGGSACVNLLSLVYTKAILQLSLSRTSTKSTDSDMAHAVAMVFKVYGCWLTSNLSHILIWLIRTCSLVRFLLLFSFI